MKQFLCRIITLVLVLGLGANAAVMKAQAAEGGVLYAENFESGTMDGWVSYEDKSGICETEDGHAYCVRSYDYNNLTATFGDYVFQFQIKIDYKEPGTTAPSIYVRRGADGNRYELYIDAANRRMVVDRVINEVKTTIGEVNADFAADNLQWVTVKMVLSGKNIWIYYQDMETPAAELRDETPLMAGGVGFGYGNAEFYVDNIIISELSEPLPEPYETNPEEEKDYRDSPYVEEIDQLRAFGIIHTYEDGTFRPENLITRAEFAALAVRARNITSVSVGALPYVDVETDSWAAPIIASACAMGYMNGVSADSFAPNEPITMEQAAKVLVRLLGAEVIAQRRGGYPIGYLAYSAQRGITDGVQKENTAPLTRGEVAKLLANTIKLDLLSQTAFGETEEYRSEKGVTLLSEYRDIYFYKGRVTANYFAGIYADESLGKNELMLDGLVMDSGETALSDCLGYCVQVYARLDHATDKLTAVWYDVDEEKSDALVISAENILDVSGLETLCYFDIENDDNEEVSLSKNTNVILNGGSGRFTEENMKPESGQVTLFDADGDGVYEIALVECYQTVVVGSVAAGSRKITDKLEPNKIIHLDESDAEITIRRGFQEITLEEIAPLEVLSVAQTADGAMHPKMMVLASEKRISGKSSEYEFEDEYGSVVIKGKSYPISPYLRKQIDAGKAEELIVGQRAVLHLDSFGKIAYVQLEQSSDFALLSGVMWQGGADSGWLAKLFDSNGEWRTARISDSLTYNGKEMNLTQDNLPEVLSERQIVRVKFNRSGEITTLDTAQGSGVLVKNRVYEEWPMEFISATMSFDTDSYVDENTLVFAVPFDESEEERYLATDSSYFKNGSTYRLWSYNEDKFEVADIILVFEKKDSGGNGKLARPFFFERLTRASDSEGNAVTKINGYRGGEKISFVLSEEDEADFTCGDVLVLSQNGKGEVVAFEHIYRAESGAVGSNNDQFGMSSDRVTVTGTVTDFDAASGRLLLDVGKGETREKAFLVSKVQQVYLCQKAREKITLSTVDEISVGDFIMMDFSWNTLRDIMIYR